MRGKKTFHAINWNKKKNNTKSKMIDPKQQENTLPIRMHLIVEEKKFCAEFALSDLLNQNPIQSMAYIFNIYF